MSKVTPNNEVFINMTKISNKFMTNLYKEIQYLRSTNDCYKFGIPLSILKTDIKNSRWILKTKCPFCNELITYKNYYLTEEEFHGDFILCRKCNKRFYLINPKHISIKK